MGLGAMSMPIAVDPWVLAPQSLPSASHLDQPARACSGTSGRQACTHVLVHDTLMQMEARAADIYADPAMSSDTTAAVACNQQCSCEASVSRCSFL